VVAGAERNPEIIPMAPTTIKMIANSFNFLGSVYISFAILFIL
jgi:hypothetical protein